MAVSATYTVLDRIIGTELGKGRKLAIFPMGRIGTLARYILENKYACKGIYIDNSRCADSFDAVSLEKYKEADNSGVTILLATNLHALNQALLRELHRMEPEAEIINIIDHYDGMEERLGKIRDLCRVRKAEGHQMTRIGARHDGGYVMIDDFKEKDTAYSIGIASEISWDMDMAHRGMQVYCFDHTIQKLPAENKNLHFFKLGLCGRTNLSQGLHTLDTMLALNHHEEKSRMILKIDIEGAEWDFLQRVPCETLSRFSQITMELHHLTDADSHESILSGLEKINRTHQPVWVHANSAGGVFESGDLQMPELLEVTFANRNEYTLIPSDYDCPTELDFPNTGEKDIRLAGWGSTECREGEQC